MNFLRIVIVVGAVVALGARLPAQAAPAHSGAAQSAPPPALSPDVTQQKKGETVPRPKPKPGPVGGNEDD